MEYEQLENGKKIIEQAIISQDVGDYFDLMAKDVVLVTHFPYPDSAEKNLTTALDMPSLAANAQKQLKRQLLKEQADELERQRERYRKSMIATEKNRSGYDDAPHRASDDVDAASPAPASATAPAPSSRPPPVSATPNAAKTSAAATNTAAAAAAAAAHKTASHAGTNRAQKTATRVPAKSTAKRDAPAPDASSSRESKFISYFMQSSSPGAASDTHSTTASHPTDGASRADDDYDERVDLVRGRRMATQRFYLVLMWLSHKKYIADIQVQLEARKGILQDSEVLPAASAPQTGRDRYLTMGRQLTNRNQMLSRLTVVWGSEYLLFSDQYYFDDGVVVSIQRRMLSVDEMLQRPISVALGEQLTHLSVAQRVEQLKQEVLNFYGVSSSSSSARTTAASSSSLQSASAWPLLDYSFLPAPAAIDLLRLQPITGKIHIARAPRPAPDPHLVRGVFLTESNDPALKLDNSRVLIKARNKKGDEEAYEFDRDRERFALLMGNERNSKGQNSMEELIIARKGLKYDASSVRVSGCQLSEQMDKFVLVLRAVVANALVTVHSLDLSNNALRILPDFTMLPLQKLQLHSNQIGDWQEVERRVSPLPYLTSFTLHGNPLSEKNENYWNRILTMLLNHPARRAKLRQLDFVTLTAQDYNVAAAYTTFVTGDQTARARITGMLAAKSKTPARTAHPLGNTQSEVLSILFRSTMSSRSVMASSDAYVKALLHCYKHPTQPMLGILVGKHLKNSSDKGSEDGQDSCYVVDTVPLFHTTHMAYPHPMIDVAFAHAQSAALTKGLSVVGIYYAPDRLDDHSVSALLKSVLDYVYTRLGGDAPLIVWFVDNTTLLSPPQALSVTSFSYSKDGADTYRTGQTVPPPSEAPSAQRLSFGRWNSDTLQAEPSESAESAVEAVGSALYAFAQYRIIDFEDHLEDPRINYLDQSLKQLIRR